MAYFELDIQKKLKTFNLQVQLTMDQGCLGILGASGCGKSMTLKAAAGLVRPDRGRISVQERILFDKAKRIDLPPQKRKIGYLFQDYALFPNMTVEQNIGAGFCGEKKEKKRTVENLIRKFQLQGLEKQYPARLSGGQKQRTALARSLAAGPDVLLLDEPFSAMDSYLREEMQVELARRIQEFSGCMILVSHDRDEIYRLCNYTMIMEEGKNIMLDETKALFEQPRKVAAARLTGCKNIASAVKTGEHQVFVKDWNVTLTAAKKVPDNLGYVGIRAHDILPVGEKDRTEVPNQMQVLPKEKVKSPFEWTLLFQNREKPGKSIWMKYDRKENGIPDYVTIQPEKILLLEE